MVMAPTEVLNHWRQVGFYFTHRSALKHTLVVRLRSAVVTGHGAAPFLRQLTEVHKLHHLSKVQDWRCFVDHTHIARMPGMTLPKREAFFEFLSKQYGGFIPSLSWTLKVAVEDIESRREFHIRHLQMVDGIVLGGDHSHKVAKLVFISGTRGFSGLYTLMNGYGQVVGFWFTHSTNLKELEDVLRGVAHRFKVHGIKGPLLLYTDRCCDERSF